MIAPILRSAHVRRPLDEVFALFTDQIGAWWPLATHGLFGDQAAGLSFVDGRLVERALDGRTTTWGEVVVWEPPNRLSITWHPGRDEAADASIVEVLFSADADGTRIELSHHGWDVFGDEAETRRSTYVGPNAWGFVLDLFCHCGEAETERADLAALRLGYRDFYEEAERGGFGEPPAGEWTAEQVVAHVAVNDDAMAAVCRALANGRSIVFDNQAANDAAVLDALVAAATNMEALLATARVRSDVLCHALASLDVDQLDTAVACHLVDHGNVVLDQPLPWRQMALSTQATFHLPMHTRQLSELRPND